MFQFKILSSTVISFTLIYFSAYSNWGHAQPSNSPPLHATSKPTHGGGQGIDLREGDFILKGSMEAQADFFQGHDNRDFTAHQEATRVLTRPTPGTDSERFHIPRGRLSLDWSMTENTKLSLGWGSDLVRRNNRYGHRLEYIDRLFIESKFQLGTLRVGYDKAPFGIEKIAALDTLPVAERSIATYYFSGYTYWDQAGGRPTGYICNPLGIGTRRHGSIGTATARHTTLVRSLTTSLIRATRITHSLATVVDTADHKVLTSSVALATAPTPGRINGGGSALICLICATASPTSQYKEETMHHCMHSIHILSITQEIPRGVRNCLQATPNTGKYK